MPTDVVMPQMGESIFEGTITKWLKQPGDKVQRDEPLFEISTDKVDAEIPAPASGTLQEIKIQAGATVQVNTVVGVIAAEGDGAPAAKASAPAAPPAPQAQGDGAGTRAASTQATPPPRNRRTFPPTWPKTRRKVLSARSREALPRCRKVASRAKFGRARWSERSPRTITSISPRFRVPVSADASRRKTSKVSSRSTAREPRRARRLPRLLLRSAPSAPASSVPAVTGPVQPVGGVTPGETVPMTTMRKKIAEHMIMSKRTSAHVHGVFEVDVTRIVKLRDKMKGKFEQATGNKLTFTPFFARAVVHGIRKWPIINSSVEGENIHYHSAINLGIAVALDWGLIVPVVKSAEERSFVGLQRAITDLGERARTKKLKPDEVQGGTFTITNPGIFGAKFGMPIINQPQVAIMGVGGITKKPVVLTDKDGNDSIAIRSMMHLSIGYDHRIIDGAVADQFMVEVKKFLENWNEELL